MFQVTLVARFPASRLRCHLKECIREVREIDPDASEADIEELKGYIREFLREVDAEFPA